jgi:FkbM family methyltransferase
MLNTLKLGVRDSFPKRFQVPIKYWYSKFRKDLEREMKLLPKLLRGDGRFIDVGANRGVYAYVAEKLCQHVELFEPNPYCADVLNSFAENRPNIRVYNVALSDRQGAATLQVPVDEVGVEHDSSATIERILSGCVRKHCVELATLDSFGFRDVKLIKIDVEGHESKVVYGAAQTISSQKPALLIEIEQRHLEQPLAHVFKQVQDFGYAGFFLGLNCALYPLSEFEAARHQAVTNLGSRRHYYINNFLFLHRIRLAAGQYSSIVSMG